MTTAAIVMPCLIDEAEDAQRHMAMAEYKAGLPVVPYIEYDKERIGFIRVANRGIRAVLPLEPDYVCLLNADACPVQRGWYARLIEAMEEVEHCGFAGPSMRCGTFPQRTGSPGFPAGVEVVRQLNFSCTVICRKVLEQCGLFDERYIHYGGDYAYLHTAQERGWRAVWVRDVYVWHDWHDMRYREWKEPDRELFYSEWTKEGMRL